MLYGQSFGEVLIEAQVDGPTLTAAAAASCIPPAAKFPLPGQYFSWIGKKLRIDMSGRVSTLVTTPGTFRIDIRFGGTVVFDSLAIALATADAYTNQGWRFHCDLIARNTGTAMSLFPEAWILLPNMAGVPSTPPKAFGAAMLPWNTAPAVGNTFDGTVQQVVDVFFTQTVATGSQTVHTYELVSPN
jgi:hypothetical protein